MRAFELMRGRSEELALLISLENGKSLADARSEVAYAAEFFRWYAEEGVRLRGQLGMSPSAANRLLVSYQPVGVSVLITPWNFPAAMATRKIAPALAAGCTAVLKPAAETPLTALAVAAILAEAGLPARRAQRRHDLRPRTGRRDDARRPAYAHALLHRLDRGRATAAARCRGPRAQVRDGARRQRPVRRPGRRRRRRRGRGRHGRQDAQRRPGLHGRQPVLRARRRPRRVRRRARREHVRGAGRPGPRRGLPVRSAHQRRSGRQGRRAGP